MSDTLGMLGLFSEGDFIDFIKYRIGINGIDHVFSMDMKSKM